MSCGCDKRAEKLLYYVTGCRRRIFKRPVTGSWVFETPKIFCAFPQTAINHNHFRVAVVGLLLRVLFGKGQFNKKKVPVYHATIPDADFYKLGLVRWSGEHPSTSIEINRDGKKVDIWSSEDGYPVASPTDIKPFPQVDLQYFTRS